MDVVSRPAVVGDAADTAASSAAAAAPSEVQLCSSDGVVVHVDRAVAELSGTIMNLLAEDMHSASMAIPLAGINGDTLKLAVEFSADHVAGKSEEWKGRLAALDQVALFGLMLGANFLDNKPLLDITCQYLADVIGSLNTVEELRKEFNIVNDFTPEEEARAKGELAWLEKAS